MKKIFKGLVFIPFITFMGCSLVTKSYKEGPEPFKEEKKMELHFGPSPSDV